MDIACKYNGVVCFGGNVFNLLLIYLCKIVCELLSLFMPPTFSSSTSEYGIYLFPNTQLFSFADSTMCHRSIHCCLCVEVLLLRLIKSDSTLHQWLETI